MLTDHSIDQTSSKLDEEIMDALYRVFHNQREIREDVKFLLNQYRRGCALPKDFDYYTDLERLRWNTPEYVIRRRESK